MLRSIMIGVALTTFILGVGEGLSQVQPDAGTASATVEPQTGIRHAEALQRTQRRGGSSRTGGNATPRGTRQAGGHPQHEPAERGRSSAKHRFPAESVA